jgi:hypothetical protein
MRTYMCLEAHEVRNTTFIEMLRIHLYIYIFFIYIYIYIFFFYFRALRRAFFFLRLVLRKLRVKFGICTNLGNVCFFLVGDLKFI